MESTAIVTEAIVTKEETKLTIETKFYTWYVDYNHSTGLYKISKDERVQTVKHSLGDAFEYILQKVGSTRLKVVK